MGRLTGRLSTAQLIGIDTSIFIYHLEAHKKYSNLTHKVFSGIESGMWSGLTSVITLMELTVHPWKSERHDIARRYEALIVNFPNLKLVDIDRTISRRAAQLRARFNIQPADALQSATCLVHNASLFITNDSRLTRLEPVLDILLLDDYISET